MGLKLKGFGKILGAAAGAFLGGPVGAEAGYTAGSLLDGNSQTKEAKSLYKWQLGQETANNIALWNMQNAYNTPKAQMLRFKEAGLNSNLIYGQTNTSTPISTAHADLSLDNTGQAKNLSQYLALSNLGIQKDLSSAQVRNIDNSIDMSKLNYGLARDRLALDRDNYELRKKTLPLQLQLLGYQVRGANSKSKGIIGKAADWMFGQTDPNYQYTKADDEFMPLDWN